tara:strand:- start:1470 stop:1691 length:222 start_codon:yes stop_codon:yes gene_type:complete
MKNSSLEVSYKVTDEVRGIEESDSFSFSLKEGQTEENITYQEILDIFCYGTVFDCEEDREGVSFCFWNDNREW